jgi:autotransporter-associated beta strand protein
MKSKRIHLLNASLAASFTLLAPSLHAAAITWDAGGGDNNWSTVNNWSDNASATGDSVTFNSAGALASGTTNTVDSSISIASLTYSQESATLQHTTAIAAAQTLTVTGNFLLASSATATTATNVTLTGATGTLTVGGTSFQVGQTAPTAGTNSNSLDMSGLGNFNANLGASGIFRMGSSVGTGTFGATTTVKLAATSNITADILGIGDRASRGGGHVLKLGSVANTLNANTISIGPNGSGGRGNGELSFETGTGTLQIRAADGTSAVNAMNLINTSFGTSSTLTATVNFSNHSVDAKIGTLTMGRRNSTGTVANASAEFTFNSGTLEVTTLNLGENAQSASTSGAINATMNIGGGSATFGTITIATSVGGASTTTTGVLNFTAGTTTVNGNITRGGGNGTTANLNLNGTSAVLDMTGKNLTGLTNITYTNGLLKNLGTVNTGITLAGTGSRVFDQATGISGAIQGAITGTGVGLTKQGAGTLTLTGTNTYDGATQIDAGTLVFGAKSAKATGTATTAASGSVGLGVHGSNAAFYSASEVADLFNTNTLTGFNLNSASGVAIDTANAGGSFDQTVALTAARSLTKLGSGTLILSQANSYSGGTILAGGIITANHDSALGSQALTFNGGTRLIIGNGVTVSNNIVIGANSGTAGNGLIQVDGAMTGTVSGSITINNAAAAGAHFATTGGGILNLTGPITQGVGVSRVSQRTGTVVYSGGGTGYTELGVTGTARLGANNGLATTALVNIGGSGDGTLDLAGFNQSVTGVAKSTNAATIGNSSTSADSTLTTTGTSTFAGTIVDTLGSGTRKVSLTVNGGSLTLSGTNTYSGATTVAAGTLAIAGAGTIANSPRIEINSSTSLDVTAVTGSTFTLGASQTLAGGGTVIATGKTVNLAGTLAPGASPGTITQNGGTLQLAVAGDYNWQIQDALGVAGTAYDTTNLINGATLDLSLLSAGNTFNINLWSLASIGPDVNGNATNFDNTQNYSWTLFSTGTAISGFSTDVFTINTSAFNGTNGFTNSLGIGTFNVGLADGNTDLVLNFTPVPEPRTALLAGLGALALLRRRRTR